MKNKGKWIATGIALGVATLLTGVVVTAGALSAEAQSQGRPIGHTMGAGVAAPTPLGTSFTYQGQLKDGGSPVNGSCDMRFRLYDEVTGGSQVGATINATVPIADGLFTVSLDFGEVFAGAARWLEIRVQCPGDVGFTALSPRQPLTPAPYALALPGLWTQQNGTSPNLIGGYEGNAVAPGVVGATIGGGGASGWPNQIFGSGDYATIGGGYDNTAGGYVATVGGGGINIAIDPYATVGGGWYNTASGSGATVGGGYNNTASGGATVSGGYHNTASASSATVGGGGENTASDAYATIGGGFVNTASGNSATVGGGEFISVTGEAATVAGGSWITVTGDYAAVGGGEHNTAIGYGATVAGGYDNTASGASGSATVGGGNANTASGNSATIAGGWSNTASGGVATVGGGHNNLASGMRGTIGGGEDNTASNWYATVPGGLSNTAAGEYSFASGRRAKAYNDGCFVWSDSYDGDVACNNDNRTIFRSTGGFYIYTTYNIVPPGGLYLAAGGSSWNTHSDRNAKENFRPVDTQALLADVAEMPISTWNYQSQDPTVRHIGPMAQDFNALLDDLGGEGEEYINTLDADGVALAAIQGLYAQNQVLKAENADLRSQMADLEARVTALEDGSAPTRVSQSNLLPWAGILLAGAGLAWASRRRDSLFPFNGGGR